MKIEKFKRWLIARGCEILPTTNPYELIRFRGREVGIVYTTGKTNSPFAHNALMAYENNTKWDGAPISTGRHPGYKKEKAQLIERDGTDCFYCGKPLGEDITVEHLIALSCGGKNSLSNMVLAHEQCNRMVGNLPITEKVKVAIENRSQIKN